MICITLSNKFVINGPRPKLSDTPMKFHILLKGLYFVSRWICSPNLTEPLYCHRNEEYGKQTKVSVAAVVVEIYAKWDNWQPSLAHLTKERCKV